MIAYSFKDGDTTYTRIPKSEAKQMYDSSKPIYLIPHKMRMGFALCSGMMVYPKDRKEIAGESFENMLDGFTYYNCSRETGSYPAFYKMSENKPKTEAL